MILVGKMRFLPLPLPDPERKTETFTLQSVILAWQKA
jgi:hypothetical protein